MSSNKRQLEENNHNTTTASSSSPSFPGGEAAIQTAHVSIGALTHQGRKDKTKAAYEPRQREYIRWAQWVKLLDGRVLSHYCLLFCSRVIRTDFRHSEKATPAGCAAFLWYRIVTAAKGELGMKGLERAINESLREAREASLEVDNVSDAERHNSRGKKRKATSANNSASAKQRNKRTSTEENAVVDAEQGRDEDERSDADAHDDENEERVEHEDTGEAEEACDSFHIVEENYPSKHGGSVSVRASTRGIQRPSLAECTAKLTKKEIEALNDSFKLAHPSIQDNQLGGAWPSLNRIYVPLTFGFRNGHESCLYQ